ncbi:MAG: hypothetical protein ACK4ZW_09185 [Blastomonas sp.]|jgi:hypothetical protein
MENLTGFWSGSYWYDEPGEPTVPFMLNLTDDNGALSGEASEPNTVGTSSDYLKAFIKGTRTGALVAFAKVYDGASDLAHRVDYAGSASNDGQKVSGYWLLEDYSGGFEMTRTLLPAEELTEMNVEVPVIVSAPPAT